MDLVETLLTASVHTESLGLPDGKKMTRHEMLKAASDSIQDVMGFRHVYISTALLRERLGFELGEAIDWNGLDEVFDLVVGDVDAYPQTISRNIAKLREKRPDLPQSLKDLVRDNWTNPDVLRGFGTLYLRRGETQQGPSPTNDCRKAYAIFEACRLLEEAFVGMETPVTTYCRARAIAIAATQSRLATPFRARLEGRRTLVDLSEALLQRIVSVTVGQFREEARRRVSEVARLRIALKATGS